MACSRHEIVKNDDLIANFYYLYYKISTTMAKLNTADIGFEDQIWKATHQMRSNIDGEIEDWK